MSGYFFHRIAFLILQKKLNILNIRRIYKKVVNNSMLSNFSHLVLRLNCFFLTGTKIPSTVRSDFEFQNVDFALK